MFVRASPAALSTYRQSSCSSGAPLLQLWYTFVAVVLLHAYRVTLQETACITSFLSSKASIIHNAVAALLHAYRLQNLLGTS